MGVKLSRVTGQIINLPFDSTNPLSKLPVLQDQFAALHFPLSLGKGEHLIHFFSQSQNPTMSHLVELQHLTATQLLEDNYKP